MLEENAIKVSDVSNVGEIADRVWEWREVIRKQFAKRAKKTRQREARLHRVIESR